MRDLTEGAKPSWTRERFVPEAILVRLPTWRAREDGQHEFLYEKANVWRPIHPIFADALDVLKEGGTFDAGYERALRHTTDELKANHVRAWLRKFWWELHRAGYIRIPLPPPPDAFDGRYQWVEELGRGGVGVAHLCRDPEGRLVVVKHAWGYLHRPHETDRSMRAEGAALKAFDHPGIVPFIDEFEREDLYHLVRGYGEGAPLPDLCKDGALPARREVARGVAEVLRHVHERGYVFLDVTPKNFLLRADGTPLAIDVGLCKPHVGGVAAFRSLAGSRGFVAPEVMGRRGATLRTDVFGLGCLYYHLSTGRAPAHNVGCAQRLADLRARGGSDEDARIVEACTADEPDARPADMDAVLRILG